jgi:predicted dehydrogenase
MHNIGIIGYGAFGRFLKQSWDSLENARVGFITKTQIETVQRMAEEDGVPKYSSDYHDLLADPETDIVVIATPPHLHERMAVEALRAGKHVFVEKPLAMNPAQAESIIRAAEEAGRVATVNFLMRYGGLMEKFKLVCEESLLGKLRRVIVENYADDSGLRPDHWFWDRSKSGGILIEHGVHFFDLVGWLAESVPTRIEGFASERAPGIQDKVMACVEYENRIMATFYHAFSGFVPLERTTARYVFDRGQVDVFGWIPMELELRGYVSEAELRRLSELFPGSEKKTMPLEQKEVIASGVHYQAATDIKLHYTQSNDKQAEYANCARGLMADMISTIERPGRQMRVDLADGLRSVQTAFAATQAK